jgi:hypothetical protein
LTFRRIPEARAAAGRGGRVLSAAAHPGSTSRLAPLAVYAGVLGLLELLLTASVPAAAAGLGLLAFGLCLLLPAVPDDRDRRLLPVLVAVPAAALAVIAAPTAGFAPVPRLALLAVPTSVAVVAAARAIPRPWPPPLPRSGGWRTQVAVSLLGLPLGALWYLIAGVPTDPFGRLPLPVGALLVTVAVIPDEMLHRGLLLPACAEAVGRTAVPVAAAVYSATFLGYGALTVPVTAFVTACALGWCRLRTGSPVGAVAARILTVLVVYVALPAVTG